MFKKENLRKNFLRVKQNIDQNLGRAEQSKVLTEDEQENEKRVEAVKHAFQNITKKAGAVLQAAGPDVDKRLKKLPETALSHALVESAQALGPETLLGNVCLMAGDCQMNLAREQVVYEGKVEQEFISPLQAVVDNDIPSIVKLRKALSKSILDMDSAKTRLNQMMRQSQVPGTNMTTAAAKVDTIRDECDEATLKMENIKDNLSIEMCNFAAKEHEHSNRLLMFLEAQANFHRKALEAIEGFIPHVEHAIKNSPSKPCYGMALEEHLRLTCRDVAVVLEACIVTLLDTGMEEEGLFRLAGSAVKLKKLKACFDANVVDMTDFGSDPHTVAGALKLYLRELPEPLLTFDLYDDFLQVATLPTDQRLQALWTVISRLPKPNYNNFRYLVKFLAKLAEKSDINKMKPSNIAIVVGPNLLWSEKNNTPNMATTGALSGIIEAIVTHADWFFPGEQEFNLGCFGEDGQEGSHVHSERSQNIPEALTDKVDSAHPATQNTGQVPSFSVSSVPSTQSSSSNPPVPSIYPSLSASPVPFECSDSWAGQKRAGRKPAPPPPPQDRSGTLTGGVGYDDGADNYITGQSQSSKTTPIAFPETQADQHKISTVLEKDRQKVAEKPSIHHPLRPDHPPPDRPQMSATLYPSLPGRGHQRSASTGALISPSSGSLDGSTFSGVPNAGSSYDYSAVKGNQNGPEGDGSYFLNSAVDAQNVALCGSSDTLGRHVSMHPRPTPPPPPPPVARESEYTKL